MNRLRPAGRSSGLEKLLDKLLGVPFLFVVGHLRFKAQPPAQIQRIALLKASAIGDTVLMSGTVLSIKKKYPNAHLTIFVGKSNAAMARLIQEIDAVVEIPVASPLKAIRQIRSHAFDVWLDFGTWTRLEAIFSFFSRARFKVGFKSHRQFRHFAQDASVEHSLKIHESENYFRLLAPLGQLDYLLPQLRIPEATNVDIPKIPFITFHMWAGGTQGEKKKWPQQNWIQLGKNLSERYLLVLSGGPEDRERNDAFIRESGLGSRAKNIAGLNLLQTAQILKSSQAVVSIDTGVLHICSALNLPVVGLHGATHSSRWGALSPRSRSLNAGTLEQSPLHFGWENIPGDPMTKISVSQVLAQLREMGL